MDDARGTTAEATLRRLQRSLFRSKFALARPDVAYLRQRGYAEIREHALRFLRERIAPAEPRNDGRQTPWRGHPVFVAQHATATCCRGCVAKWHGIEAGSAMSDAQLERLCDLVMVWLTAQLRHATSDGLSAE